MYVILKSIHIEIINNNSNILKNQYRNIAENWLRGQSIYFVLYYIYIYIYIISFLQQYIYILNCCKYEIFVHQFAKLHLFVENYVFCINTSKVLAYYFLFHSMPKHCTYGEGYSAEEKICYTGCCEYDCCPRSEIFPFKTGFIYLNGYNFRGETIIFCHPI